MSRVTNSEHYQRHQFLQLLFTEPGLDRLFALLPIAKQWELHDCYRTAHDLNEAVFIEFRRTSDFNSPSLAHRAGKHFRVIERAFIAASRAQGITRQQMKQAIATYNARQTQGRPPGKTVSVLPIAKPFDAERVARVFMMLARYQLSQGTSSSSSDRSQTSVPSE